MESWGDCRGSARLLPVARRLALAGVQFLKRKPRLFNWLHSTDKEFTDRLFASREREPSGQHVFDQTCQQLNIALNTA